MKVCFHYWTESQKPRQDLLPQNKLNQRKQFNILFIIMMMMMVPICFYGSLCSETSINFVLSFPIFHSIFLSPFHSLHLPLTLSHFTCLLHTFLLSFSISFHRFGVSIWAFLVFRLPFFPHSLMSHRPTTKMQDCGECEGLWNSTCRG